MNTFNELAGQWIGDVRGTDIGNAYAETTERNGDLEFDIRVNVSGQITALQGTLSAEGDSEVSLTVTLPVPAQDEQPVTGVLRIEVITSEQISGQWSLSNGAAGALWLQRVSTGAVSDTAISSNSAGLVEPLAKPMELIAKEASLPRMTMYRQELETIISRLESIIPLPARVVVTADIDGTNMIQFADDFLKRRDLPRKTNHIKLNISDGHQPIAKSILITLSAKEDCKFNVQSDDPTWTSGVNADLGQLIKRYTSRARVFYQKYGLNLNGIIFLAALVMLPDLSLQNRIVFFVIVVLLIVIFAKTHTLYNTTKIFFDETKRGVLVREYPTIISTMIAAAIIGVVSVVFKFLVSGELTTFIERTFN